MPVVDVVLPQTGGAEQMRPEHVETVSISARGHIRRRVRVAPRAPPVPERYTGGRPGSRTHRRMLERAYLSPGCPFQARLVDESDVEAMVLSLRPRSAPSPFARLAAESHGRTVRGDGGVIGAFLAASTEEETRRVIVRAERRAGSGRIGLGSELSSAATSDDDERLDAPGAVELVLEDVTGETASELSEFVREVHDAASCYVRIDSRIRALHRRRKLDLCLVAAIETQLVSALFAVAADEGAAAESVKFVLENSYKRLVLHGLCQYYGVVSRSYDDEAHRRVTEARRHESWQRLLPDVPLHVFLARADVADTRVLG